MSDGLLLTSREIDVMTVLWEQGSGTVADVRAALSDPLAYTTILTVLRRLERKRIVSHIEDGTAYRYLPRVTLQAIRRSAVARLIDQLFERAPALLIAELLDNSFLTPSDLAHLAARANRRSSLAG